MLSILSCMKKKYLIALFLCISSCLFAQKTFDREYYLEAVSEFKTVLTHEKLHKLVQGLQRFHPFHFDSIRGRPIKQVIYDIDLPQEKLTDTEFVFHARKFLDCITEEDPHFMIAPVIRKIKGYKVKNPMLKAPPFVGIQINDTLLVHKSLNEKLKRGDKILSINSIPVSNLIAYAYRRRYMNIAHAMLDYHISLSNSYQIVLQRGEKRINIKSEGIPFDKYYENIENLPCESKIYGKHHVGYFKLQNFDENRQTFKQLNAFCKRLKKEGVQNLILDLRENPGGSGYMLDVFYSLFSSSDSIPFLKNAFYRASPATKHYGFSELDMGKLLPFPEKEMFRMIPLNKDYYIGEIKLYVLMSEYTFSTAASFANVVQFNKMGVLAGEALKKNALKYGEIDKVSFNSNIMVCSTAVFDEHTKAQNGILTPDIEIPYIAKEYMQGGDPVLEKLLEKIGQNKK